MELNNVKEKIDKYFAETSAEELYYKLTDKYNLTTNGDEILMNKGEFQNINDTLSDIIFIVNF